MDGGELINVGLRWLHVLAGVTWIGVLYYFNFIQTPFFGSELGGQSKSAMTRGLVPNALWWFRWGAMFTFLSGFSLVLYMWHGQNQGLGSGYMTLILTGALMGILMFLNVWLVIWPAQKVVIANAENVAAGGQADPSAAGRGARAGLASRTNTLFSIPMLLFMVAAANFKSLVVGVSPASLTVYWPVALALIGAVEANALLGPGLPTQKPLATVSGTIHAGLALSVVLIVLMWLVF